MKTRDMKLEKVEISLYDLAMLCLNVDYRIEGQCRDEVEDISVRLGKKYEVDSHIFRLKLKEEGMEGTV